MENGLSKIQQALSTTTSKALILKEQEPKETKKIIAILLQRLSKLYQIPNWSEENAVILTEWIHENYKYETLETIIQVLTNPPNTGAKNWRLTPDTIQEWMAIQLDKEAEAREKEHEKRKLEGKNEELVIPDVDFNKVIKGTWFENYLKTEKKKENEFNDFRKSFYGRRSPQDNGGEVQENTNEVNPK